MPDINPYTTIRIYRDDRPILEKMDHSAAEAIHSLLHPCEHPLAERQFLGRTVVFYPADNSTLPVTIYKCVKCNMMIVLPGEPVKAGEEA